MKKKITSLSLVLCMVVMLFAGITASADQTVNVTLATFPIKLGEQKIDTSNDEYPFIIYNDITYLPLTYYGCAALGLASSWTQEAGLSIAPGGEVLKYVGTPCTTSNNGTLTAKIATGKISICGKAIDNSKEQYPFLVFRDITYIPMTWANMNDLLGCSYEFTSESGLSVGLCAGAGKIAVTVATFPVTLNGQQIDGMNEEYPFIFYNGITYLPLTYYGCKVLGLESSWSAEEGLSVCAGAEAGEYVSTPRVSSNEGNLEAEKATGAIYISDDAIDNSKEEYPFLFFRNVTYLPMTWVNMNDRLGCEYAYDSVTGLTISAAKPKIVEATGVELNHTELYIPVGDTETLSATVLPAKATDKTVTWSTSNKAVATVDQNGVVKGIKTGTATITVKTANGKEAKCDVTVVKKAIPLTGVTVTPDKTQLACGTKQQLAVTFAPTNTTERELSWSSANESVATVSETGVITAVSPGLTSIFVTGANDKYDICTVEVLDAFGYLKYVVKEAGDVSDGVYSLVIGEGESEESVAALNLMYDPAYSDTISLQFIATSKYGAMDILICTQFDIYEDTTEEIYGMTFVANAKKLNFEQFTEITDEEEFQEMLMAALLGAADFTVTPAAYDQNDNKNIKIGQKMGLMLEKQLRDTANMSMYGAITMIEKLLFEGTGTTYSVAKDLGFAKYKFDPSITG